MNLEELKKEAAKHGYTLVKKRESVSLEKCPCGNRGSKWSAVDGYTYKCGKCGFKAPKRSTDVEARKAWNEAVAEAVSE